MTAQLTPNAISSTVLVRVKGQLGFLKFFLSLNFS